MNQINRYQIKDVLGGGGMARVYRAYDPRFKREVAIKVMAAHLLHDPQFRQRSSREAQVIASRKRRRLCQFDPSAGSGQALGSRMGT